MVENYLDTDTCMWDRSDPTILQKFEYFIILDKSILAREASGQEQDGDWPCDSRWRRDLRVSRQQQVSQFIQSIHAFEFIGPRESYIFHIILSHYLSIWNLNFNLAHSPNFLCIGIVLYTFIYNQCSIHNAMPMQCACLHLPSLLSFYCNFAKLIKIHIVKLRSESNPIHLPNNN